MLGVMASLHSAIGEASLKHSIDLSGHLDGSLWPLAIPTQAQNRSRLGVGRPLPQDGTRLGGLGSHSKGLKLQLRFLGICLE